MIKRLLTAILFVMAYLSATTAQTHFYVWQKDGTVTPFEISTVDSISFTPKTSSPVNPGGDAKDQMPSDAKTLASKIYLGWNIGNTLDCPGSETAWGNPAVTQSLIDAVKNATRDYRIHTIPTIILGKESEGKFTESRRHVESMTLEETKKFLAAP